MSEGDIPHRRMLWNSESEKNLFSGTMMDMVSLANRHELARVSKHKMETIDLMAKINIKRSSDLQEDGVVEKDQTSSVNPDDGIKSVVGQSFLGTYRQGVMMGILWLVVYILLAPLELISAMFLMGQADYALGVALWLFAECFEAIVGGQIGAEQSKISLLKLSRCRLAMVMMVLVVCTAASTLSLLLLLKWETQLLWAFCGGYFLPQLCTHFILNRPTIAARLPWLILLVSLQCVLFTTLQLLLLSLFACKFVLLYLQFRVDPQLHKTEQNIKKVILLVVSGWIIWDGGIQIGWGFAWTWEISIVAIPVIISVLGTRIVAGKYIKRELFNNCYTEAELVIGFGVANILLCSYSVLKMGLGASVACAAVLTCAFNYLLWLDSRQNIAFNNNRISSNEDYLSF